MSLKKFKEYFEVEAIVGSRYSRKKRKWYYLVKWVGYSEDENTWEPEEHLTNV